MGENGVLQKIALAFQICGNIAAIALVAGLFVQVKYAKKEITSAKKAIAVAEAEFEDYKRERRLRNMEYRHKEFTSEKYLKIRAKAAEHLLNNWGEPPVAIKETMVLMNFFEKISREEKLGLITSEDVLYYFHENFMLSWCIWEPWITQIQERDEKAFEDFENLYNKLMEKEGVDCSEELIKDYLQHEIMWGQGG